ncbi:MAG: hypothetical protein A2X51_07855 [Candidatus Rokubacteria bacterium GWC2_70_24]|nr:MAG: hypothetical protein A2X53_19660 [Candidatus Rokubacteria bacterium GWA2_70_23]OGK91628.1 MAG: hypothetical protein A2X51_07855 [Candidatus Rokubacteria bacterium GWC2_70_24]OGK92532.1 MAG: hypothetical protein A2X50_02755 [Candidatus Rokubacteria bacterium GWF2_70_14]
MPASRSPLADLLADLRQVLAGVGARWYLFGAQAAILHGAARLTADVDITVDPGTRTAGDLAMALGAAGFEPRVGDVAAFAEANRVLPLVHARTRIPVDVVLAGPGLEDLFFARAEQRPIGDVTVPVACAEDVVTMKVLGGRAKDLDDAAAILRAQRGTLDLHRVRETLRQIEQALDRSDLVAALERIVTRAGAR